MAEQTYSEQLARYLHKAEECAAFARAAASQQPCDGEMPDRAAEWRAANWWDGLAELLRQAQANCERMEALEAAEFVQGGAALGENKRWWLVFLLSDSCDGPTLSGVLDRLLNAQRAAQKAGGVE